MSTSEKWASNYAPCPCKRGRIVMHVDSPDNPWSKPTMEYELVCDECSKTWILDDTTLSNREASVAASAFSDQRYRTEKKLIALANEAIDQILREQEVEGFKTEYKLLKAARLCVEGPIRYSRRRAAKIPASVMCKSLTNLPWIISHMQNKEEGNQLRDLAEKLRVSNEQWELALRRKSSIQISSLRSNV